MNCPFVKPHFPDLHRALHLAVLAVMILSTACQANTQDSIQVSPISVMVVESFLVDITRNIAGDRIVVESLIPEGIDPHTYQPTPQDIIRINNSRMLILNGAGLESWLSPILDQGTITIPILEASSGLTPRVPASAELVDETVDPHFWLDPIAVVTYVENIRNGISQVDPVGRDIYMKNADGYIAELIELDGWINDQVSQIPSENRLLITNHESFGYFADRYGFLIVGTIIPSVNTGATPTASQLIDLIQQIHITGAKAIFLEAGSNPELAETIAEETGVTIVMGLLTHSLTSTDGEAPTYIALMQFDTRLIVDTLK